MYYIFYSTNDVFEGEERFQENNIKYKIVPTPIKESIFCGVCLWSGAERELVEMLLEGLAMQISLCIE